MSDASPNVVFQTGSGSPRKTNTILALQQPSLRQAATMKWKRLSHLTKGQECV